VTSPFNHFSGLRPSLRQELRQGTGSLIRRGVFSNGLEWRSAGNFGGGQRASTRASTLCYWTTTSRAKNKGLNIEFQYIYIYISIMLHLKNVLNKDKIGMYIMISRKWWRTCDIHEDWVLSPMKKRPKSDRTFAHCRISS
jgi:hypothetical protein